MSKDSKFLTRKVKFGILLVLLSVLVYSLHYLIYRDSHHIFIYFIGDVGFVFIEVLLVTLILHQVLSDHEKRLMLQKLNMVIGAFFSEVGTPLLKMLSAFDAEAGALSKHLLIDKDWSPEHFDKIQEYLVSHTSSIEAEKGNLSDLKEYLVQRRAFLVRLLENPNLLEHESFTKLLWAVFHLMEELSHREQVYHLSKADIAHLEGDIKRVYSLLICEWLDHLKHLKENYPYLFSLAVRTNPFSANASVEFS